MPVIVTLADTAVSAQTIITRAMRLIEQLPSGGTPTALELADGLEAINALLDSWRNETLMGYARQEEALTLVSGQDSYTIGSGGDLNTNRPVRIDDANASLNDSTHPVRILNEAEWAGIPSRTESSDFPTDIYYKADVPVGTLYVYPVPNGAAVLYLVTVIPLLAFSTVATTTYLPPGWKEALDTNLAIKLAPEFGKPVSNDLRIAARDAKASIKNINNRTRRVSSGLEGMFGQRGGNILTGQ